MAEDERKKNILEGKEGKAMKEKEGKTVEGEIKSCKREAWRDNGRSDWRKGGGRKL